jgi:methyl-accepting chemotaxis protein/methyl-accepting chemotaxis protein-1 (serine sensor receptor)
VRRKPAFDSPTGATGEIRGQDYVTAKLSVKQKLLGLYLVAAIFILLMGGSSLYVFSTLYTAAQTLSRSDAVKLSYAAELTAHTANLLADEDALITAGLEHDTAAIVPLRADAERRLAALQTVLGGVRPLLVTPEGKALVANLTSDCEQLPRKHRHFVALLAQGDAALAHQELTASLAPAIAHTGALGDQLLVREKSRFAKTGQDLLLEVVFGRWAVAVGFALCGALGFVLYGMIARLDRQLRGSVQQMSEGANEVASAVAQIGQASLLLARETTQQVAHLEQTSAACIQISAMAERNADQSGSATTIFSKLGKEVDSNGEALQSAVTAMASIDEASQHIQKIIVVIDQIAFQTNILSLNAAVEAARAGESGLGFAVVADEVRNLAMRSAKAAQETSELVERCVTASRIGKSRVVQVSEGGGRIRESFRSLVALVDNINEGSLEQRRGTTQISHSVTDLERSTQSNAAAAEQTAAAAEQLTAQSARLNEVARILSETVVAA